MWGSLRLAPITSIMHARSRCCDVPIRQVTVESRISGSMRRPASGQASGARDMHDVDCRPTVNRLTDKTHIAHTRVCSLTLAPIMHARSRCCDVPIRQVAVESCISGSARRPAGGAGRWHARPVRCQPSTDRQTKLALLTQGWAHSRSPQLCLLYSVLLFTWE